MQFFVNVILALALTVSIMFALPSLIFAVSVPIFWQDNSNNEDGFPLERKVGDGPWELITVTGPNVNAYTDNRPAGEVVCYRVWARNAAGDSGPSNEVCKTLPIAPEAPSGTEIRTQ